jgi:hypothetical protein
MLIQMFLEQIREARDAADRITDEHAQEAITRLIRAVELLERAR